MTIARDHLLKIEYYILLEGRKMSEVGSKAFCFENTWHGMFYTNKLQRLPFRAGDKLIVAHGIVLFKGL